MWTAWSSDNPIHGDIGVFLTWEQFVAHELGGEDQGDYRRFDILLPDGQTAEVKQLSPGEWTFRLGVHAAEQVDPLRTLVNSSLEEAVRIIHANPSRILPARPAANRYYSRKTIDEVASYLELARDSGRHHGWPPATTSLVMEPSRYRQLWDTVGSHIIGTDFLVLISQTDGFYVIDRATYSDAISLSSFGPSQIKGVVREEYRRSSGIAARTDKREQKKSRKG